MFIKGTQFLLLFLLSIAPASLLEGPLGLEILAPRDFEAWSGDLVVWTRQSPLQRNLSSDHLFLQLLLGQSVLDQRPIPQESVGNWEKVAFPCPFVSHGGVYTIRVVGIPESGSSLTSSPVLWSENVPVRYPTVTFEVPHGLEAYTTATPISLSLIRSPGCEPNRPLPPTKLQLSICSPEELQEDADCVRDFTTLLQNPLQALQKEGHISTTIDCHLWARNASFRVQLREKESSILIAKSGPIRVEWGQQFGLNVSRETVMPCRRFFPVLVTHPTCTLSGDRVRVYGEEALPVHSPLGPSRLSYIGEQKVPPQQGLVRFRCSLFPQRFIRFCFHYVNYGIDGSVAVVMEKCVPTNPPLHVTDGGWGPWSVWTACTVTCGSEGRQYRYRFCDNPPPSSGANFCQGESIQERACDVPDCPEEPILYADPATSDPAEVSPTPKGRHGPRQRLRDLEMENVTLTDGCECGCILYDLVPGHNETLVVFISPNYSTPCADEDEVDHHKFRWIFHAKSEENRIRVQVVELEVQCVTISFRDGNTTDSNLLHVISSEDEGPEEEEWEGLTLESSGSAFSIAAYDTNAPNCSGQFIYFLVFYETLPGHNLSLSYQGPLQASQPPSEFWTLLGIKVVLIFFLFAVLLSFVVGAATKYWRKGRYRELLTAEENNEAFPNEESASRSTSFSMMSYDHAYWRQLRLSRLKSLLLRSRSPLKYKPSHFPSTPTLIKAKLIKRRLGSAGNPNNGAKRMSKSESSLEPIRDHVPNCDPDPKASTSSKPQKASGSAACATSHLGRKLKLSHLTPSMASVSSRSQSRSSSRLCPSEMELADNDFEMDYYDYDVLNAGNIPGSYLGLEPAFVLWNSEVQAEDEVDPEPQPDQPLLLPRAKSSTSNATTDEVELEMTSSFSQSQGIFTASRLNLTIRETSLDTLKFADDEEDTDVEDKGIFEEELEKGKMEVSR